MLFTLFGAVLFVGLYILFAIVLLTDLEDTVFYFIILGIQHILILIVLILLLTRINSQKSELQHLDFSKFFLTFTMGIIFYLLSFIVFWIGYYFIKDPYANKITVLFQEVLLIASLILQSIAWIRFNAYTPLDTFLSTKNNNRITLSRTINFMLFGAGVFLLVTLVYFIIDILYVFGVLTSDYSTLRIYIDLIGVSFYGLGYVSIGLALRGDNANLNMSHSLLGSPTSDSSGAMTKKGATNLCARCGTEIPENSSYCADCEKIQYHSDHP
jgi:hypothetical protein